MRQMKASVWVLIVLVLLLALQVVRLQSRLDGLEEAGILTARAGLLLSQAGQHLEARIDACGCEDRTF